MSNWEAILRMDANRELLPAEKERYERIKQNHQRMVEMGLLKQVSIMEAMLNAKRAKPTSNVHKTNGGVMKKRDHKPVRASARIKGVEPEYAETIDLDARPYQPLEDLLADDTPIAEMNEAQREELQQRRCGSQGRGSIYDSALGITCHFCRQKKLCGEVDCPRCSARDPEQLCSGKTECQRCHGATGRFCRACLLIRYGETLEDARQRMAQGEWLCPHCYEEEHPEEGWLCNSSICMKRAGRAPTGIAIFEAQKRGYASVAHWLQAQYKRKYSSSRAAGSEEQQPGSSSAAANEPAPQQQEHQQQQQGEGEGEGLGPRLRSKGRYSQQQQQQQQVSGAVPRRSSSRVAAL